MNFEPEELSETAPANSTDRTPVRAVHRAFELLALIGERRDGHSLSELARAASLPVSTTARLVATLEHTGFVERGTDGAYRAGSRLLQIGLSALRSSSLYEFSEPYLRELSELSGETANLIVRVDASRGVYLRQFISPKSIHHSTWLGMSLPLDRTASGRALLGDVDAGGYVAMRDTLERDVTAVAAPVYDVSGRIAAAFSITGPTFRISNDDLARYGAYVADVAGRASYRLGDRAGR